MFALRVGEQRLGLCDSLRSTQNTLCTHLNECCTHDCKQWWLPSGVDCSITQSWNSCAFLVPVLAELDWDPSATPQSSLGNSQKLPQPMVEVVALKRTLGSHLPVSFIYEKGGPHHTAALLCSQVSSLPHSVFGARTLFCSSWVHTTLHITWWIESDLLQL